LTEPERVESERERARVGARENTPGRNTEGWFAPLYKWKKEINLPAMQLGGSSETKLNSNTCNIENSFAAAAVAAAAEKRCVIK